MMQIKDLPPTQFIGIVSLRNSEIIAELLRIAKGHSAPFQYWSPVFGGPRSIRLLADSPFEGAVKRESIDLAFAASEIIRLMRDEARYNPPVNPGHEKGIEVRRLCIDDQVIVLVQSTWVK